MSLDGGAMPLIMVSIKVFRNKRMSQLLINPHVKRNSEIRDSDRPSLWTQRASFALAEKREKMRAQEMVAHRWFAILTGTFMWLDLWHGELGAEQRPFPEFMSMWRHTFSGFRALCSSEKRRHAEPIFTFEVIQTENECHVDIII